jgi:penicillin V acylase-like amidase (Ntn superfamily)
MGVMLVKKINIEIWFTGSEYNDLIDTTIKLNDEYYAHYHLDNLEELTEIIQEVQEIQDEKQDN